MSDWPFLIPFAKSHAHERLALVTLVQRVGSSYRPPGARMLVTKDGSHHGSLSGGCLEDGLAKLARSVIESGQQQTEVIDTRPHFGCPGTLTFLIEAIEPHGLLEDVDRLLRERITFRLQTNIGISTRIVGDGEALQSTNSFVETIPPCPRLIAVGATPDLAPVFAIARVLGWECQQVTGPQDKLGPALVATSTHTPSDFIKHFQPDPFTAVLVMSHQLTLDLSYLKELLPKPYAYIGLLGSRQRRESILNELAEAGLMENPEWVDRFYAPVGLDLGGHHPSSIALAIVAEIQAVFANAAAGFLRDRLGSIHSTRLCPA